jgi:hypothetical protein
MDCSERNSAIFMRFRQAKENAVALLKRWGAIIVQGIPALPAGRDRIWTPLSASSRQCRQLCDRNTTDTGKPVQTKCIQTVTAVELEMQWSKNKTVTGDCDFHRETRKTRS